MKKHYKGVKYKKVEILLKNYNICKLRVENTEDKELEDLLKKLDNAMAALSAREQNVIKMFYFEDKNLTEIAKVFDITTEYTSKIKTVAINELGYILDV